VLNIFRSFLILQYNRIFEKIRAFGEKGGTTMQWFKVILAGLIEILWVTGLNTADSLLSWIGTIIIIIISFFLVISACKSLPVGTVYAVFVGIGAVGTVLVDMLFFGDPFNFMKIILIILLVIGIIGLKLTTEEAKN
jgi:paired small multidrug resistance pump